MVYIIQVFFYRRVHGIGSGELSDGFIISVRVDNTKGTAYLVEANAIPAGKWEAIGGIEWIE